MSELYAFHPPRRRGLLFHGALILVLGAASAGALLYGLNQQIGAYFVLLLLASLLLFAPLPWLAYRMFSLVRASYRLERDGLRLRWGLRAEDIPLPDVEWVRRWSDLATDLRLPRLRLPGAILGTVHIADLGAVEYMASNTTTMVLIATTQRIYAISPDDPETFLRSFQRTMEMGSLTPINSVSLLPAAYLSQVWAAPLPRILLTAGFLLNLLLFAGVGLVIPGRSLASLGFYPSGAPLPAVPAAQMLLLPILAAFIYVVDLAAGLFFYRREHDQLLACIIWGSSVVTALLLVGAVLMILATAR